MKIKKGDKVKIIKGKDKGKTGLVVRVFPNINKLIVEGMNMVKKHVKPDKKSKEGGIIKMEAPINISNVMYFDAALGRPIRIGSKTIDGKKYRVNNITKEVIEK